MPILIVEVANAQSRKQDSLRQHRVIRLEICAASPDN